MTTSTQAKPTVSATWINVCIIAGCAMFVLGLAVSAFFAPEWRALHVMQALPYVVVILLSRRMNPWGFGAGAITASFWNAIVLFRSPIGAALVHGNVSDPSTALSLIAAAGHCLVILGCQVGFARIHPSGRQWRQFLAGGVIAVAYLLVMVWTVGPPEGIQHMKQAFGLA